jgi:hypothetical protein
VTLLRVETYPERFPRRVSIEVHDYVARLDAGPVPALFERNRSFGPTCLALASGVTFHRSDGELISEGVRCIRRNAFISI